MKDRRLSSLLKRLRKARPSAILRGTLQVAGIAIALLVAAPVVFGVIYRFLPPPGTFTMLERKLGGDTIIHPWTPIEHISPNLVRAVIAAEDSRFCAHNGFDLAAIEQAMQERKSGESRRGASTISQQTAKNVYLWNGGGWFRKGLEAWATLVSDRVWGKRRTMEIYLNVAEWGDGYFGAEAAARGRFGKSAKDLTREEAALLAAVLPSPNKWKAASPGPYVRSRASLLMKRMDRVRLDGLDACVLKA